MSIIASKTCAAKSAAKLQPIFELHNTFPSLFQQFFVQRPDNGINMAPPRGGFMRWQGNGCPGGQKFKQICNKSSQIGFVGIYTATEMKMRISH